MPRRELPAGYITAGEAASMLKVSDAMLSIYVRQDKLKRYGPENRKHKFYKLAEVQKLAADEKSFFEPLPASVNARFMPATTDDMNGVYQIAAKLFQSVIPISAARRQEWMSVEPRGHYVVKKDDGTIVAYVHFVALDDELINRYMRGEVYGKQITAQDVRNLEPGRPRACIVPSIASDPELADDLRSSYISVLLRGVFRDLVELGKQGIIIPRMYAWTEWNDGIAICAKMGMQPWSPPVKKPGESRRYNYWLDVLNSPISLLQPYQQAVQEWQARQETPELQIALSNNAPAQNRIVARSDTESDTTPGRQKATDSIAHNQATQEQTQLPDGLISWWSFADVHHIAHSTISKAVKTGRLASVRGEWRAGRALVKEALDAPGRRQFWELYHSNPHFQACPDCPHEQ